MTPNWVMLDLDLGILEDLIAHIENDNEENLEIEAPNYIISKMRNEEKPLPMNHSRGAVVYYRKIMNSLKNAKDRGYFLEEELPKGAPPYLEAMVRY